MVPFTYNDDNWDAVPDSRVAWEHYLFLGSRQQAFWRTEVRYENNNARGDNFLFNGIRIGCELFTPLKWGIAANGNIAYTFNDYPRNTDSRRDNRLELNAELRRGITEHIALAFNYNLIRNSSNVSLYQFKRDVYSMIMEFQY
jgi:hypothetical protein